MTLSTATVATRSTAVDDRARSRSSCTRSTARSVRLRTRDRGRVDAVMPSRPPFRQPAGSSRQRRHLAREVVAARGVALVPVERRARRRQQHRVAGLRERRRGAHRVAHRVGAHDGHRAGERRLDLAGRLADGDDRAQLRRVRAEPAEVEALVAAAGDQHHVLEARRARRRWRGGWWPSSRRTNATPPRSPTSSTRCGEAGEAVERARHRVDVGAHRERGGRGGERVGDVVRRARSGHRGEHAGRPDQVGRPPRRSRRGAGSAGAEAHHPARARRRRAPARPGRRGWRRAARSARWWRNSSALACAYASTEPCQSRWSSATLSSTATSGANASVVNASWNDDTSTTTTSTSSPAASSSGRPMLPAAALATPAARSIAAIERRDRGLAVGAGDRDEPGASGRAPAGGRRRGRSRTAPARPASWAATSAGWSGCTPGLGHDEVGGAAPAAASCGVGTLEHRAPTDSARATRAA